jgi:hypothetical protein
MTGHRRLILAILALPALLLAYSEEDWRAYSRSKVELVDTFNLPFEAAGPFVLLGDKLVFLSKGRDSLVSLDTTTRAVADRARIASAWNMDISAMTAYDGKLYLLSRSTRAIYRYEPEREGWTSKVLLDLGKVHFDGEPMLTTFAYDGDYVYMVVLAGFSTRIVGVRPADASARFFSYATGNPAALWCDAGVLYYMRHRDALRSRPAIQTFATELGLDARSAGTNLDVELPCDKSVGFAAQAGRLWCTSAEGGPVAAMRQR